MSNFKSMKGAADGTIWNPTSVSVKGKDGKDYNSRAKNPAEGKGPTMVGYYTGFDVVQSTKNPDQKPTKLHKFQNESGEIVKVWGSHDLDKQLAAGATQFGLGRLTQVQWNGYLVKHGSKDKPEEILSQKLVADYYHDWDVAVDDVTPAIKVEGAEVYKSNATNEAAPVTAAPAPEPVAAMPASLDEAGSADEDDLPF